MHCSSFENMPIMIDAMPEARPLSNNSARYDIPGIAYKKDIHNEYAGQKPPLPRW